MAASDETIDPNDLDSIDALLDEAELEVTEKNEAELAEAEKTETSSDSDLDAIDSLLDEAALASPLEAENKVEEEAPLPESIENKVTPPIAKKAIPERDDTRSTVQSNPKTEMTVKEMDSIKKLIIIFGSALVVLALIGIGMGLWSALAAKGSALDDETKTLIETIQVGTERAAVKGVDSNDSIQAIESKLDALNFQLEELASDLSEGKVSIAPASEIGTLDPLGLNGVKPNNSPDTVVNTKEKKAEPESLKLAASVNKKMIAAQRRIDEVNRRVKDIQSKYKGLLLSVKSLEKQLILRQKQVASKDKESQKAKQQNREGGTYQYTAPNDAYYEQSVGDSYP